MSTRLQQLENNEAILMMYLANELATEDRGEVEQMLQTDGGLRAELERLRAMRLDLDVSLAQLDAPLSRARQERALRRVSSAMQKWTIERLRPVEAPVEAPARRFPWWGYPVAAVASVGVLLLIWWQVLPTGDQLAGMPPIASEVPPEVERLADDIGMDRFAERDEPLDVIENELQALQNATIELEI